MEGDSTGYTRCTVVPHSSWQQFPNEFRSHSYTQSNQYKRWWDKSGGLVDNNTDYFWGSVTLQVLGSTGGVVPTSLVHYPAQWVAGTHSIYSYGYHLYMKWRYQGPTNQYDFWEMWLYPYDNNSGRWIRRIRIGGQFIINRYSTNQQVDALPSATNVYEWYHWTNTTPRRYLKREPWRLPYTSSSQGAQSYPPANFRSIGSLSINSTALTLGLGRLSYPGTSLDGISVWDWPHQHLNLSKFQYSYGTRGSDYRRWLWLAPDIESYLGGDVWVYAYPYGNKYFNTTKSTYLHKRTILTDTTVFLLSIRTLRTCLRGPYHPDSLASTSISRRYRCRRGNAESGSSLEAREA